VDQPEATVSPHCSNAAELVSMHDGGVCQVGCSNDGAGALLGEPLLGLLLGNSLELADLTTGVLSLGDSATRSLEDDIEVHTENTGGGIVLDTKIDMLIDTEAEVALVGEVGSLKLVLLNLESGVEELLSLSASDSHMHSNFLISLDRERSDGVASLRLDGLLLGKILQHLGGLGELITGLTSTQVEDKFLDLDLTHGVVRLTLLLLRCHIYSKCKLKDKPAKLLNNK